MADGKLINRKILDHVAFRINNFSPIPCEPPFFQRFCCVRAMFIGEFFVCLFFPAQI